ncbi:hypothetical protein CLTHE_19610 [Clostridium thermobutyricum DSM 4928]|uniref:DUF1576 domain-containing protein n=1 Tax=Clostridium thermobutyricum DSM 4928 TaxID=1121339 RepID=A0A1V4SVR8_9CLOT|nr:hypothetical protein CLTHE_19610 [Clostridium thermobutyricum DSM 4928]
MLKKKNFFRPYKILLVMYLFFLIAALLISSPSEILNGLKKILLTPDILITDYIAVGGISSALFNAGITSIISILMLIRLEIKPNGSTIMALFLMTGFAFFGKNLLNIWPIMFGVYLFSKYQKQPLLNYSLVMLLSTALAPTVSQLSFTYDNIPVGMILGAIIGVITGFILTPIASHCILAHSGYNLYNIGFAGGLIATLLMSILRSFGIDFESRLLWHTGSNKFLLFFMMFISIYLISVGIYFGKDNIKKLNNLSKQSGKLVSDFYLLYGDTIYINMGILGLFSTLFLLLIGGDLNGPTLGGIFTIIGFGCFGKHLKNITPILIGATLAALININPLTSPSIILAILFSTCLAPIAGKFGFLIGILAGFLHVCLGVNVGYLHGGLNLYNNGFAGGLVAMILVPLITTFKREVRQDEF